MVKSIVGFLVTGLLILVVLLIKDRSKIIKTYFLRKKHIRVKRHHHHRDPDNHCPDEY